MKKFIGLFVMFFMLTSCFATASTLVQHSLDKKVFVQAVDTPAINFVITLQPYQIINFDVVKCPVVGTSYIYKNFVTIQNYIPTILNKTAEVQNKDVVWLTNMKSK